MKNIVSVIVATLMSSVAISQIIYTDLIPDDTLVPDYVSDSRTIDFDGDFTPELIIFSTKEDTIISGFNVTLSGVAISTMGNSEIIAQTATIGNEDVVLADTLHNGDFIGSTNSYLSSATPSVFPGVGLGIQTDFFSISAGDFINNGDLYFGVKFNVSTDIHYGWVRVKVDTLAGSGIVYDYAYQSIADSSILAGDTDSGFINVENHTLENVLIYSANKVLYVSSNIDKGEVSVYNLLGKMVLSTFISNKEAVNVGHLTKGIYLVSFSDGASTVTKKVYID